MGVFKYIENGVGEMGQRFGTLTALAKDPSSGLGPLWKIKNILNSISRVISPSSDLHRHCTAVVHLHTARQKKQKYVFFISGG